MKIRIKSIPRYLLLKQYLKNGYKWEDIKQEYLTQLKKGITITEQEIKSEINKLYKIYFHYFLDSTSNNGLKNLEPETEQEEKLFDL